PCLKDPAREFFCGKKEHERYVGERTARRVSTRRDHLRQGEIREADSWRRTAPRRETGHLRVPREVGNDGEFRCCQAGMDRCMDTLRAQQSFRFTLCV